MNLRIGSWFLSFELCTLNLEFELLHLERLKLRTMSLDLCTLISLRNEPFFLSPFKGGRKNEVQSTKFKVRRTKFKVLKPKTKDQFLQIDYLMFRRSNIDRVVDPVDDVTTVPGEE